MTEGRPFHLGPQAGAIGRDQQNTPFRRQHAPELPQERTQTFGRLQAMHDQNAVEHHVRKQQAVFLAQNRGVAVLGPGDDAQMRGHGGDAAFGLAENAQVRHRKAIAQHPVPR